MISGFKHQNIINRVWKNGLDGERYVAHLLAENGFLVYFNPEHPYHGYDLCVFPNIEVEVKTSTLRKINQRRSGYQFNLFRVGHSKRIHEPITILLCDTPGGEKIPFIIPSGIIAWKSAISISGNDPLRYSGKWSHYCKAFDRIRFAGGKRFIRGSVTDDFLEFMRGLK